MKLKKFSGFILISLFILCWTACNDDDDKSIKLLYVEDNSVNMTYPNQDGHAISIIGGDGNYSISCNATSILDVELTYGQTIVLRALAVGDAIVTIQDQSNNSYILNVHISYYEENLIIANQYVRIVGGSLSDQEMAELETKALASIPAGILGGYKFIYNNPEKATGTAFIYTGTFGENGKESTFERVAVEGGSAVRTYLIQINGESRKFELALYQKYLAKSTAPQSIALVEDVTERFKAEYPTVEAVYTQQLLK